MRYVLCKREMAGRYADQLQDHSEPVSYTHLDVYKRQVVDKGALDCTLKARVECAVYRSNDITENLPWGGVIR